MIIKIKKYKDKENHYIPFNMLKTITKTIKYLPKLKLKTGRRRNRDESQEKKWNGGGGKGGGFLYANFFVGITDGTLNVVGGIYFRRSFRQEINWNAHQKFRKCRLLFLSVGNYRRKFTADNSVGNSDWHALRDV